MGEASGGREGGTFLSVMTVIAVVVVLFDVLFQLSVWAPFTSDDYAFLTKDGFIGQEAYRPLASLQEAVEQGWHYYFVLNGRFLANVATSALLLAPKFVFDVVAAVSVVAMIVLAAIHATGRLPRTFRDAALIVLIAASVWLFSPSIGDAYIWKTGVANYTFPMVFILAFLLPYRRFWLEPEQAGEAAVPWWPPGMALFVLGVVAAWGIEHLAIGISAGLFVSLVSARLRRRPRPGWFTAGIMGFWLGTALHIVAPGNWVRAGGFGAGDASGTLVGRLGFFADYAIVSLALLWAALVVVAVLMARSPDRGRLLRGIGAYAGLGLLCSLAMLPFPTFPGRTAAATTVFVAIAAAFALDQAWRAATGPILAPIARAAMVVAAVGLIVPAGLSLADAWKAYARLSRESEALEAAIRQQTAAGVTRVVLPAMTTANTREVFLDQFHDSGRGPYLAWHHLTGLLLTRDTLMQVLPQAAPLTVRGVPHVVAGSLGWRGVSAAPFDADRDVLFFRFAAPGPVCVKGPYASLAVRAVADWSPLPDRLLVAVAPATLKPRVATHLDFTGVAYRAGDEVVFPTIVPHTTSLADLDVAVLDADATPACAADTLRPWPLSTAA